MLTARIKDSGYENVIVDCPGCQHELVFNRASDLGTLKPISGKAVSCEQCNRQFWLNGDHISERHETLLFDCHDLLGRKRYMHCVINICQAYEMFFSLYLRVNLLYKPFALQYREIRNSIAILSQLSILLEKRTEKFTFNCWKAIFLRHMITSAAPKSLDDAREVIKSIDRPTLVKDKEITSSFQGALGMHLQTVKNTKVNNLRNKVVHKSGYRPTSETAEKMLQEARSILFPLTHILDLHDDIN